MDLASTSHRLHDLSQDISNIDSLDFKDVMQLKHNIETQLDEHIKQLESHNITMSTDLVGQDGFPRSDIDILEAKYLRRNIIMLRNDLDKTINSLHSKLSEQFENSPFATITEISPNSPVAKAGILNGDKLISAGGSGSDKVDRTNHSHLQNLVKILLEHENKNIQLNILRQDQVMTVTLLPTKNWDNNEEGKSILGCKLEEIP